MCAVYLAADTRLGRPVALKVPLTPDGKILYFLRNRELWRAESDGSHPRRTRPIGLLQTVEVHLDVSPSGQIAFTQFRPGRAELWTARIE